MPRNVLLIVVDQWRGDMLPCLGADWLHLPNLQRLSSEGVTITCAVGYGGEGSQSSSDKSRAGERTSFPVTSRRRSRGEHSISRRFSTGCSGHTGHRKLKNGWTSDRDGRNRVSCSRSAKARRDDPDNFAHYFRRLCARADVGHWTPHELRHSAASITKDIYGYLIGGEKQETTEAIAEALFDVPQPRDLSAP